MVPQSATETVHSMADFGASTLVSRISDARYVAASLKWPIHAVNRCHRVTRALLRSDTSWVPPNDKATVSTSNWIAQVITTRQLNTSIIVRRVATGARPFGWEVQGLEDCVPRSVSFNRFDNMEAAYSAGQAWLRQSLSAKPAKRDRPRCNPVLSANTQANDLDRDDGAFDDIDLD
jgi:hypothetical protein